MDRSLAEITRKLPDSFDKFNSDVFLTPAIAQKYGMVID